ncbi:MAG: ABC transporter permease [Deltaproteobacteria bacterium]|nr:ABC transporter permease [Deltaproteobacteria bacterium]
MSLSLPYAISVWKRNAAMYKRSWKLNLLPNFFEPVFYLTSIGVGVGAYINEMAGLSYAEFLAPGLVCVAAMNGASFEVTYNVFVRMEFEKSYDAMLTTPIEPVDILMGELLWAMTRSCIYGFCFFLVIGLFGLASFPNALLALLAIPVTGALFGAIGLAFTMWIRNIDLYSFYFTLFLTPLFLFSGVFFPLEERLTGAALIVAEVLPLLHPVRFARACFLGQYSPMMIWDLLYCVVLTSGLLIWAKKRIQNRLSE